MCKASIIIPSVSGWSMLAETLLSLEKQEFEFEFEVIVVDRVLKGDIQLLLRNYPRVNLIVADEDKSIPEMRAMGTNRAIGEFLVITEDHCIAPRNWLTEIIKAHQSGYDVVGGAVENGSQRRLIDWAVFLCEYSSFMPPVVNGETDFITGNNTSYRRLVFDKLDKDLVRNYWEYFLQAELKRMNIKFLSVATLIIEHRKEFGFIYFLHQRFLYSRSFASMRKSKSSLSMQFVHLFYTPLIPFHQSWKIFQNVRRKRRNFREFFLSLPFIVVFMIAYALGEFVGQIFGAGNSLKKVE